MMSIGAQVVDYLSSLVLSGGDCDGEYMTVLPWERRFVLGAFRQSGDSALSVARGNGKSALVAGIASAVVDPAGPLHGNRREVVVVAASFEQSRIIFEDVLAFLSERYDLSRRDRWRKQDSTSRATIEFRQTGARVRCIGSHPGRAHGLRPFLALLDEPAQWDHAKADRMLQAIRTGLGKSPGSRLVALGTRPADEAHWFARALVSAPYSQTHAARPDDPPFQLRTIRRANPSLDHLPSLRARILAERDEARRDPDSLASYRALRLNQGTSDVQRSVLIDSERGGYVLGIDLGQNAAMSAASAYFRSGWLLSVAAFPQKPSLAERGLADGVGGLYQRMADRSELIQAGGRVSDLRALLGEVLDRWGSPALIVVDRWREAELRQHLEALRFPRSALVVRGQGYRDGGQDVRDFRAAVLGGHVRPAESLLLTAAMAEARVVVDPAGNAKLAKSTEGGRRLRAKDDAAAAAILAVSAGFRRWHGGAEKTGPRLRSAVVR